MKFHRYILINILFLLACTTIPSVEAAETIRLQLKWQHQFQFAGYYAAKELGYYQQAGLDVEIIEGNPNTSSTKIVLRGDAEYGVGNSGLLLSRNAGEPVVVLAVIFQHSPFILLSQQHNPTQNIHDLANKHLMIEPHADELIAYLNHESMPLNNFKLVEHKHSLKDFISGKVDAISAYSTTEPYLLKKQGIKFHSYSPRSVGIDFYGDNLFTTETELKQNPERVQKFREASLRGWRYAMEHQEEIIDLILNKYSRINERNFLAFEADQMQKLMHPELIDIGYMLTGRWQHIAETYAQLGMLPDNLSLSGFIYDINQPRDYFWLYVASAIMLLVLSIITLITIHFSKLNKKLSRLLHVKSQFENIGESVNNISHQWKQPLNELGFQLMLIEQISNKTPITEKDTDEIRKITNKSHDILEFMATTASTFGHLLRTNNKNSDFSPEKIIQEILYLVNDTFKFHNITITYDSQDNIHLNGNSTEFAHIILSIINNAKDIFIERHIKSPHIQIRSYINSGQFIIEISDNGGGILIKPIDHIFNLGFSDKQADDTGVGLYIAKKLIKDNFSGEISVKNNDAGAVFILTIPQLSNEQS